jgi:hypothetical protein
MEMNSNDVGREEKKELEIFSYKYSTCIVCEVG